MDALHGSSQTAVSHSVRVLLRRLPMADWDVKGLTKKEHATDLGGVRPPDQVAQTDVSTT